MTLSVIVNGINVETSARTLFEFVALTHLDATRVATALNGTFVSRDARAGTRLARGDVIEVVSARQGG